MRFNDLLHLIAFPWKAHGTPPASVFVTATKMPESRALSKFSDHFSRYIPLSARGRGNRGHRYYRNMGQRSIPAWAGEPSPTVVARNMAGLMKLFDDKKWEGSAENVQQSMSKFGFVNESSADSRTSAIRRACESWFEHIPPGNRADLKSRFRESDDSEHAGAFFELFLHEVFRRLDCQVEFQPNVSGQTPDFRVSQGGKSIYVEATVAGATSNPFHRSRNEQDVIDKLNTLSSPDFSIGVDMEGTLKNTLRKSCVTSKFRRLLDVHDPGKVRGLIAEAGCTRPPMRRLNVEPGLSPVGLYQPVKIGGRTFLGDQSSQNRIAPNF